MDEQETIESEYTEIKKEYTIKKNDNKLKIEINNDEIKFILLIGISHYKYIKKYKYKDIINELNILDYKDMTEVYEYLIKSEYEIIKEEKKIIINKNKEIKLDEKLLKNEEIIKILIEEINEIKDNNNKRIEELIKVNEEKEQKINKLENNINDLKEFVYKINDYIKLKYKDEIDLVYVTEEEGYYNIFGKEFVKKNKDKIELNINGKKNNLINKYKLIKGENRIKMKIKNKITDLKYMFHKCNKLKNIDELKYLDTKYCNNFEGMFSGCSSLSDINALKGWNVSNVNNFSFMFCGCSSLLNVRALKEWNVSNGNNFEGMFCECSSLSDIKGLEKWNLSNGNNFKIMFSWCSSLSDINGFKQLEQWNISNAISFQNIFYRCSSLSDYKGLEELNILEKIKDKDYRNIKDILQKYKDSYDKCKNKPKKRDDDEDEEEDDLRITYITNFNNTLEKFIDNLDNKTLFKKLYLYVKELFLSYVETLKLDIDKEDQTHINNKIKEYIIIFINNSSRYLNSLLEILKNITKGKRSKLKILFYELVIFIMEELNKRGEECINSNKPFCKYHSLIYFEQTKNYYEKYLSNIEALLKLQSINSVKKQKDMYTDYLRDINSGAVFLNDESFSLIIEEIESIWGDVQNRIEIYKNILSKYEKMLTSLQTERKISKNEAICITIIIKLNVILGQIKSKHNMALARRVEFIIEHEKIDKNEEWYKEFIKLNKIIIEY